MDRIPLLDEYRLIERNESEVSSVWKGAHLLLFFMAFVFGSFCTFCFHMLMYLFDENCVLFPKLQSLTSLKSNVIYKFTPAENEESFDQLPVDFLSSQWVEKSACYLPTYMPLVSGIFGLVWTTMFLMCSTGPRTHTGLQRPWRVMPPVFLFSLVMSSICIYSSAVTHYGLNELCVKLGEVTGSSSCSYTVNVATLAFERRIRGVYQAIRLTIISAWLHTLCWLLSAALAMIRVALAVDFQLVRIQVSLIGNIDKMLDNQETLIRTVSPEIWVNEDNPSQTSVDVPVHLVHFTDNTTATPKDLEELYNSRFLYLSETKEHESEHSLVAIESNKLARVAACEKYPKAIQFIVKIVYDLLLAVYEIESESSTPLEDSSSESLLSDIDVTKITRQYGQQRIKNDPFESIDSDKKLSEQDEAELTTQYVRNIVEEILLEVPIYDEYSRDASGQQPSVSLFNLYSEMKSILDAKTSLASDKTSEQDEEKTVKKSNLKYTSVQTDKKRAKLRSQKVQISEPENMDTSTDTVQDADKETQTSKEKEKQD